MSIEVSQIKDALARGELKDSILHLLELTQKHTPRFHNEVLLHSARLQQLHSDERRGIVRASDAKLERTKITYALLDLLDEIVQIFPLDKTITITEDIKSEEKTSMSLSNPSDKVYDTAAIRNLLKASFSDEEFLAFCFDYFRSVYEHFSSEMSRVVKIHLLIEHCQRHGLIEVLLSHVKQHNPYQFAAFESSLRKTERHYAEDSKFANAIVEVRLSDDLSSLTPDQLQAISLSLKNSLAQILKVPSHDIKITDIRSGSTIFTVEVPSSVINRLKAGDTIVLTLNSSNSERPDQEARIIKLVEKGTYSYVSRREEISPQIFLCYATEDEGKVEKLYEQLLEAGYRPWMAKKDILPGEKWKTRITKAIHQSDFFVACLSKNSINRRGFLQREILEAVDRWGGMLEDDIFLIPLRLEECKVPDSISGFQWVDLFHENGLQQLIKAISVGTKKLNATDA